MTKIEIHETPEPIPYYGEGSFGGIDRTMVSYMHIGGVWVPVPTGAPNWGCDLPRRDCINRTVSYG